MSHRPRHHRPRDYLPRELRDACTAIRGATLHNLSAYWHGAIASAAAVAGLWMAAGGIGECPLPGAMAYSDLTDPVDIRWTQIEAEEERHGRLIRAAGSTRTAVVVAAAQRYAAAGGDLIALMQETPGQLTPGPLRVTSPEVAVLRVHCPPGCPLAAWFAGTEWTGPVPSGHVQASPGADPAATQ